MRRLGRAWVAAMCAAALGACSSGGAKPSLAASVTTTTPVPPNATVIIGDVTYEFAMTCYSPSTGAVVAIGTGVEPGNGKITKALVQASYRDPYVGVTLGDGTVYEPTLSEPIDLYVEENVVRGGAIPFMKNLDLASRAGESAGIGSVLLTCSTYVPGLPPGYSG